MKKKIFGIKISTIISVILSLLAAVTLWLFVGYSYQTEAALSLAAGIIGF